MNSESSAALRTAGRPDCNSGTLFTAMWLTIKSGFVGGGRPWWSASSGLRSYHRLAEGDGR
ncbi:hypothetical protein FCF25_13005 [Haloprofundus sp. MHR1]|nr:hypothetical protein FCF25_13005 [Haloprofundus sp. MHR1]